MVQTSTRFGDPELLKIPKALRRPAKMTAAELKGYRKKQFAVSQAQRDKNPAPWKGATKAQRIALKRFGWSDTQIRVLTKDELVYHINERNSPAARFGGVKITPADERVMKGEGPMATKAPKTKKTAAKKITTKKAATRAGGVGVVINAMIMDGKTDDEVRAAISAQFGPDAKAVIKVNHVPWYRSKLKRDHKYPPAV